MPLTSVTANLDEALGFAAQESGTCWKNALHAAFGPAGPPLNTPDASASPHDLLWFSCDFVPAQLGSVSFGLERATALELGRLLLISKGRASEHDHHAFYATSHLLGQVAALLARSLSIRLNSAIAAADCSPATDAPASPHRFRLPFGPAHDPNQTLTVSPSMALLSAFASPPGPTAGLVPGGAAPRNLDLLLDLEMPVSISFGSTRIALKDVVKLNTGSIVELNRALSEPVDVVVNNCAIARGEVVVVDGNFAVRISEVISKQDRLRSLG